MKMKISKSMWFNIGGLILTFIAGAISAEGQKLDMNEYVDNRIDERLKALDIPSHDEVGGADAKP